MGEHAADQIRKLLDTEKMTIAWRAERYIAPAQEYGGAGIGTSAGMNRQQNDKDVADPMLRQRCRASPCSSERTSTFQQVEKRRAD